MTRPAGQCLGCGAIGDWPNGTRCPPCERANRAKYDAGHQRTRANWAPLVAAGRVHCWRCLGRIQPGEPWDLGHVVGSQSHPEHATCNRSAGARGVQ